MTRCLQNDLFAIASFDQVYEALQEAEKRISPEARESPARQSST